MIYNTLKTSTAIKYFSTYSAQKTLFLKVKTLPPFRTLTTSPIYTQEQKNSKVSYKIFASLLSLTVLSTTQNTARADNQELPQSSNENSLKWANYYLTTIGSPYLAEQTVNQMSNSPKKNQLQLQIGRDYLNRGYTNWYVLSLADQMEPCAEKDQLLTEIVEANLTDKNISKNTLETALLTALKASTPAKKDEILLKIGVKVIEKNEFLSFFYTVINKMSDLKKQMQLCLILGKDFFSKKDYQNTENLINQMSNCPEKDDLILLFTYKYLNEKLHKEAIQTLNLISDDSKKLELLTQIASFLLLQGHDTQLALGIFQIIPSDITLKIANIFLSKGNSYLAATILDTIPNMTERKKAIQTLFPGKEPF